MSVKFHDPRLELSEVNTNNLYATWKCLLNMEVLRISLKHLARLKLQTDRQKDNWSVQDRPKSKRIPETNKQFHFFTHFFTKAKPKSPVFCADLSLAILAME